MISSQKLTQNLVGETRLEKNKPPYLLGLLCLLPLIGGFVGIGLILYGIFKYKDKWMVIIGIGGIAITISVYSYLFYDLKYGENTGKGFEKIAKTELNNLVKNIEFYKLQNGSYPDSLEEISKSDVMVIIYDPLLTRKGDNRIKTIFEYEKVGNKYSLFSVGIDGVPNTTDDIFPSFFDTAKFGLIPRPRN